MKAKKSDEQGKAETLLNAETVVKARGLTKFYVHGTPPALSELDLEIRCSEIFGLLGPNGAGKTTTISILSTLMRPSAGSVEVCGLNALAKAHRIRFLIGVVPQDIALFDTLTVKECVAYFGRMYGLKGRKLRRAVQQSLEATGLAEKSREMIKHCSGGLKRRANLAVGIVHRPKVLFLDEPTVGVDPQSRRLIFDYLFSLKAQGTTIVYTTHYMEEARQLCTRIAVIDQGRLIALDRPDALLNQHPDCEDLGDLFLKLTGRRLRD